MRVLGWEEVCGVKAGRALGSRGLGASVLSFFGASTLPCCFMIGLIGAFICGAGFLPTREGSAPAVRS